MKRFAVLLLLALAAPAGAQIPDRFENLQVLPRDIPRDSLVQVMRGISMSLGVRCTYCHVGEEGKPLASFDFASDQKRTKLVARQMMLMLAEVNRRLDTIPRGTTPALQATCATCHHGVSRPAPLATVLGEAATVSADSVTRAYRGLRERYYGRDAYDLSEPGVDAAAVRLARAGKYDEAQALLRAVEEFHPGVAGTWVARGNISLLRGDTTGAVSAFREAVKRDSTNQEARGRLQSLTKRP